MRAWHLRLTVSDATSTLWTGAADVGTLMLWIAGPPLLMWLVWPRHPAETNDTAGDGRLDGCADRRQPRAGSTAARMDDRFSRGGAEEARRPTPTIGRP
jgi:hypothetical protein